MILPAVVILLIYAYVPMLGTVIAFQNYTPAKGFVNSSFVGLENFRYLFSNPNFTNALKNTVIIAFWKMLTGLVVPLAFSLMLNEIGVSWFKRTSQTIVYLPYFVSWVLMAGIIVDIFSPTRGIVNSFLGLFGIDPIFFLGDNKWFRFVLILTNVWKEFGWGTIIYMASLSAIDPSLYEAAMMDGAGRVRQTLHVTLPGLMPTIVLLATLSLGNVLNAGFDQVYNLMSPVTMQSGDIIDTLVYRIGIENGQFSVATAAGLFKSAISCLFIVASYKLADKFAGYKIF
ncbi:ABC transporter permease subunit [Ruminococcaceae bacterium OttesenSCG-928-D13]|nr:ABC transporter permease subunit [Ruminococcaceae bacterium OttesenSCG-928-D13]